MKPRVFVSSAIKGFEEFRKAAKEATLEAAAIPVLLEDLPSLEHSPRNACLDGVESCDIYLLLIGNNAGTLAPSGKPVTKEEYEHAISKKIPILGFIQDIEKEAQAQTFTNEVTDYLKGYLVSFFKDTEELKGKIKGALKPMVTSFNLPLNDLKTIDLKLKEPKEIPNITAIRLVLLPEREDELIDPLILESTDFSNKLIEIGHSSKSQIFQYENQTSLTETTTDSIKISSARSHYNNVAFLQIHSDGSLLIDLAIEDNQESQTPFAISEKQLITTIHRAFSYASAFYSEFDRFHRLDRLFYNACLYNSGSKKIYEKVEGRTSFELSSINEEFIVASSKPRLITRNDLESSDKELRVIISLLKRQIN